jgi:hypothetical protein
MTDLGSNGWDLQNVDCTRGGDMIAEGGTNFNQLGISTVKEEWAGLRVTNTLQARRDTGQVIPVS